MFKIKIFKWGIILFRYDSKFYNLNKLHPETNITNINMNTLIENNIVFNTDMILESSSINNNVANDEQHNMSIDINNIYDNQGMKNIMSM